MLYIKIILIITICIATVQIMQAQYSNQVVFQNQYDQGDPFIALHPTNSSIRVVTYYTSISSYYNRYPGYAITTNGGTSWFTGTRPVPGGWEGLVDPTCVINSSGRIFYSYGLRNTSTNRSDIIVSYTDQYDGSGWNEVNLTSGDLTYPIHDKPFITIDNTGGPRNGWLYATWISGTYEWVVDHWEYLRISNVMFAYSSNSGASWSTPIVIDQNIATLGANADVTLRSKPVGSPLNTAETSWLEAPMPAVGQNGYVYVVWGYYDGGWGTYNGSQWRMKVSTNGTSFGSLITTIPPFSQNIQWDCNFFTAFIYNIPWIAADPGSPNVYMVYEDAKNLYDFSPNLLFTKSTNAGSTWSTPVVVGNNIGTSPSKREFWPCLTLNASGVITISFVHHDTYCALLDVYFIHSTNSGSSWKTPVRVTSLASQPNNYSWTTAMMGLAATSGLILPVWNDWRNGAGSDVYYTTISKNPSSPWNGNVYMIGNNTYSGLTVNAGTVVQFDPAGTNSMLTVNGALNADGTSSEITFMSGRYPDPLKGDWFGINLNSGINSLKYCNIKHAKYGAVINSGIGTTLENCTIKNCSQSGVYALNAMAYGALRIKNNTIIENNNETGLVVNNSWASIENNTEIRNNGEYGMYAYDGYVFMGSTTVKNNGWAGIRVNSSGSNVYFSPNGTSAGFNTVKDNSGDQVYVSSSGKLFIGKKYKVCRCEQTSVSIMNTNSEDPCLPPCYWQWIQTGGYNYISGNNYWINNESSPIYAHLTYWDNPPSCTVPSNKFVGTVYRDYPLCTPPPGMMMATTFTPVEGLRGNRDIAESAEDNDIKILIEYLYKYLFENPDSAYFVLPQLFPLIGPGGKNIHVLDLSWEELLERVQNVITSEQIKKQAKVYSLIQKWFVDDYAGIISSVNNILGDKPDDDLWLFAFHQKISAYIQLGDLTTAEMLYDQMISKGMLLDARGMTEIRRMLDFAQAKKSGGQIYVPEQGSSTLKEVDVELMGNYPNPFNPITIITYNLPNGTNVTLKVYNTLGQLVRTIVDEYQDAGIKSVKYDAGNLPSGIYFYRLQAGKTIEVKKMLLVR